MNNDLIKIEKSVYIINIPSSDFWISKNILFKLMKLYFDNCYLIDINIVPLLIIFWWLVGFFV